MIEPVLRLMVSTPSLIGDHTQPKEHIRFGIVFFPNLPDEFLVSLDFGPVGFRLLKRDTHTGSLNR